MPRRKTFPGGGQTVAVDVEVQCAFCTGTWWASLADGAVVHTMPMCQKFRELEPDEFVRACRIEMEPN